MIVSDVEAVYVGGTDARGAAHAARRQSVWYRAAMCRSIKTLRRPKTPVSEEEIEAASLQFVCKVTGYHAPSRANEAAFEAAIEEISAATRLLLDSLVVRDSVRT
jgi:hypothetical protein